MTPGELLAQIQERLRRKIRQAEEGYLNHHTVKVTLNCVHKGRNLSDKISVCKIQAMGEYEGDERAGAHCCWNEKASVCPLFQLRQNVEEIRRDFRRMSAEEKAVRWPSLGELLRIEKLVEKLDGLEEDNHGEFIRQSNLEQPRNEVPSEDETRG